MEWRVTGGTGEGGGGNGWSEVFCSGGVSFLLGGGWMGVCDNGTDEVIR